MVSSPLNRDFLGRSIVTIVESGDMVDYLGRDIGAGGVEAGDETDYLGRALLPPAGPT
jgi:hypothetical protein